MEKYVECLDCSHKAVFEPSAVNCPQCGGEWRMATYDYVAIAKILPPLLSERQFNLWRYKELLPIHNPNAEILFGEGGTPLLKANNLGLMLGLPHIYIKDERQGPTASFKDRQAALTISALKEAGITEVVIASTGNVAIAYSAYAARAGIKLWAFLTSMVPSEKMREVAIYGTQVVKVTGSYDQTKKVAAEYARQRGFYLDRGTRSIPAVEGMKTIAYEVAEQITPIINKNKENDKATLWRAPDWYLQSVSGGLGPVGVQKGFKEMLEMNLIDKMPAFGIIQSEGCNPMVQAWKSRKRTADPIYSPRTHIATLATGDPGRTYTLLYDNVSNYGGDFIDVSDDDAFRALHVAAKMEGMSVEPASAVAFAGLIKMVRAGTIKPTDVVVLNCTGHTMPIESHILGDGWARDVKLTEQKVARSPEEGLLAALNEVNEERFPKVLVVDDHPEARQLIMRILQSQGEFNLLQATNGNEAIRIAVNEQPDLIILDLMMPEVDGFGVLDTLKENQKTASIPVIVVTAKELTQQERLKLKGRIQSLMQKGDFMNDDLFDEIQNLVKP